MPGLLGNLRDLDLGKLLAMSDATGVARLGLVFNDVDFDSTAVIDDFCSDLGRQKWGANVKSLTRKGKKGIKLNGVSFINIEFLDFQDVALFDEILFSSGFDDSKHRS